MTAAAEALWLRALHVALARGLLPANASRLTPAELAAEAARRGEERLNRLVYGWYYPASYGRVRGMLSDEEAGRVVTALETEIAPAESAATEAAPAGVALPAANDPPPRRKTECERCGVPLTPGPANRSPGVR